MEAPEKDDDPRDTFWRGYGEGYKDGRLGAIRTILEMFGPGDAERAALNDLTELIEKRYRPAPATVRKITKPKQAAHV